MDNNDILRRIRYILDLSDSKMMEIFELANHQAKRSEISNWLKREDDFAFQELTDNMLAIFLTGLIIKKRGKIDGIQPIPENQLNNNIVFRKLKIALNLKTEDILDMFKLANKSISTHEVSAFLRNPKQEKYRSCNDQYLRNFLDGVQKKLRNKTEA